MVMPNIYDIAEKRQGNRMNPIEAAMEGQQWRAEQEGRELTNDFRKAQIGMTERETAEFDANAGSRKQAQMIADNVAKHAEVGRVLSSGLTKETYEANAKTLQGLMPEAGFPDSWEEAQDELTQWTPYFDEQYAAQQRIARYEEAAANGDPIAAKAVEGFRATQELALRAALAKIEKAEQGVNTEISKQVENYASADASAAKAQDSLAGAAKKNAEASAVASGKPSDAKPPKSATEAELKQAAARIEADGGFARLDETERPKAAAWIAGRAKQIQEEQPDKIYADAQELAMAEARGKLSTQEVPAEGWWDEWKGNKDEKPVFGGSVDNDAVIAMAKDAIAKGKDPDAVKKLLREQYGIEDAEL